MLAACDSPGQAAVLLQPIQIMYSTHLGSIHTTDPEHEMQTSTARAQLSNIAAGDSAINIQ
jgi:hypothetical protein